MERLCVFSGMIAAAVATLDEALDRGLQLIGSCTATCSTVSAAWQAPPT